MLEEVRPVPLAATTVRSHVVSLTHAAAIFYALAPWKP